MATEIPSGPFEASDVARHYHQTPVTPTATTEIAAVLANLATATGADRATVAALTKSLAELTDVTKAQAEELRRLIQSGHIAPVQAAPAQHSSTTVIRGNGRQRRSGTNDQGEGGSPLYKTKNNNYCWSHGYQVGFQHTSATCTDRKVGHNPAATKSNIMGGDIWGSEFLWRGGQVKIAKYVNNIINYLDSTPPNIFCNSAILESGATAGNFLAFDAPRVSKTKTLNPLSVTLPDGTIIQSTHTAILLLPGMPPSANKAHLFPSHFKHSLISVGHLCDHRCEMAFSAPIVTVRKRGTSLFVRWRDHSTGLWRIYLTGQPTNTLSRPNATNNVYEKRSISDTITNLHAACFSPVKDTWIKAIAAGNFSGWPGLSVDNVRKYLAKADATMKGHMSQQRQNTRSTQMRAPTNAPALEPTYTGKTEFVYATIVNSGQIYSDLTGRFPTTSVKGNKYVLVVYDYDTNNVLTEPMKSRGDQEMVRAYNKLIQELVDHGFKPRLQRLDNECSSALRSLINQHDIQFQLVPPHMHRRNAAERAI
jgi:hypothetical protein